MLVKYCVNIVRKNWEENSSAKFGRVLASSRNGTSNYLSYLAWWWPPTNYILMYTNFLKQDNLNIFIIQSQEKKHVNCNAPVSLHHLRRYTGQMIISSNMGIVSTESFAHLNDFSTRYVWITFKLACFFLYELSMLCLGPLLWFAFRRLFSCIIFQLNIVSKDNVHCL